MTVLRIDTRLTYDFAAPADCLLQVEPAALPGQVLREDALSTSPVEGFARGAGEEGLGSRAWFGAPEGRLEITYAGCVEVTRDAPDLGTLPATPARRLPAEVTPFLMPSRYCPSDLFEAIVAADFDGLAGGALVAAVRDWVADRLSYVPGASGPATDAMDTYVARQGVCRDYAHLVVTLSRAGGVPARVASVYAPDVDPPDFHAVAEVWLDGAWRLVDATGMAAPGDIAVIGVGRDAAEVSFLTIMGAAEMVSQEVTVRRA